MIQRGLMRNNNAAKLTIIERKIKRVTASAERAADAADYAGARKLNRKLDGLYERHAVLNSSPDQKG